MSSTYTAGYPLFVDGAFYAALAWRQFDGGASVNDLGTAAAVAPAGGVFGDGQLKVIAGTGLTVTVNAGYCSVPATAGNGAYRFGLMALATLTVASNGTGSTRKDLVVANVQDLGTTGSFAQVEYVTGSTSFPAPPANSVVLAQVQVPNGAGSITSGMITDTRVRVCAPGGLLAIPTLGAAPSVPTTQLMYDIATGQLVYSPYTVVNEVLTGSGTWTCPLGTTHVSVQAWAGGAGGTDQGGTGSGGAGGGGEYAAEPSLAVTALTGYAYTAGSGGTGGTPSANAGLGGDSTFAGDTTTVHAHGGQIVPGTQAGGVGGSGSTNTLHNNGGAGGAGDSDNNGYGGGAGAAGSPSGAGAAGTAAGPSTSGVGGVGTGGGGSGGNGGTNSFRSGAAGAGQQPGGGGGGAGGEDTNGASGAAGYIILSYVVAPGPTAYPIAGGSDSWYAYDPSSSSFGTLAVGIVADGKSDYRIAVKAADTASSGFGRHASGGQLQILADGTQLDAINALPANGSPASNYNTGWTYYTSGAQGTTLPAGPHTISFTSNFVHLIGPAFIRVDQVLG